MIASLNHKTSKRLWKTASKYIASGTQTYSKQACRFVEGVYPYFLERGEGAFVFDTDGNSYIDYVASLGANLLGHCNTFVNEQVKTQIDRGVLFSLPSIREQELAIRINELIPSMESMRFLKSGSEAVSAGVKIARAFTKRDIILSNGYHGWHDWSTPITVNNAGTPKSFASTIKSFKYNDLLDIQELLETNKVACVVIEPFVFDEPSPNYLSDLIKLSHKNGALVLFDEVVSGIRWDKFAVQNSYNVRPDLTALGKTLGNGFPISCIGGRREIMRVLDQDCFVSSTYGGELVSIVAAISTLRVAKDSNLPEALYESGMMLMEGFNYFAEQVGLAINCSGTPYRQRLNFPSIEHKALFWQECLLRGVLLGGAQHTTLAHTDPVIQRTVQIFRDSMKILKDNWDNPKSVLFGKVPEAVSTVAQARSANGK